MTDINPVNINPSDSITVADIDRIRPLSEQILRQYILQTDKSESI